MPILECGFEAGLKDYYTYQGWFLNASSAINSTAGNIHKSMAAHGGAYSMYFSGTNFTPVFGTGVKYVHCWRHPAATGDLNVYFYRVGYVQATVSFTQEGNVIITKGATLAGGGNLLASSGYNARVDHWIEIDVVISSTVGRIRVKVDGSLVADTGPGVNTQEQSFTDFDQIDFNGTNYVDDIILTSAAEGPIPETVIPAIRPDGDDVVGMAPSAGSNYQCVDEVPINTTDYCEADAVDEADTYTMTTLGWTPENIYGVGIWAYAIRDGVIQYADLICKPTTTNRMSGSLTVSSGAVYAGINYIWALNPDDSAAWEIADIDGLKCGIQFVD